MSFGTGSERMDPPEFAAKGRYHLYVSWACPWAHRTIILRRLKGLEDTIGLTAVDPLRDGRGWGFREGDQHVIDPVNGFEFLSQAYAATDAQVPRARHRPRLVGHRDGAHRQQHGRRGHSYVDARVRCIY